MSNASVCTKKPVKVVNVELEADKKYFYCTCGKSDKQPFCNGAHKEEGQYRPYAFKAKDSGTKSFCIFQDTDKK